MCNIYYNLQSFFKPKIPKTWIKEKNTWLTTTDIENVIFQYEKAIKDFKFLFIDSSRRWSCFKPL